jgi:hypothetical protein
VDQPVEEEGEEGDEPDGGGEDGDDLGGFVSLSRVLVGDVRGEEASRTQ